MDRDDLTNEQLLAAIDVVGRANAIDFELGYLDDTERMEDARWWASARWNGTKVQVDEHRSPTDAAEALARRILDGGTCTHCGKRVVLSARRPAGSQRKKLCAWRREGPRWVRGCTHRVPEGQRLPYAMPGGMERGALPPQP